MVVGLYLFILGQPQLSMPKAFQFSAYFFTSMEERGWGSAFVATIILYLFYRYNTEYLRTFPW